MLHNLSNKYGRVMLGPLKYCHIESLRNLRNRERKWFIYSDEIDCKTQRLWFEKYLKTENDYFFSVSEIKRPDFFIGAVALYNFINDGKACEFGRIVIDRDATTEKGLGFDTTVCACRIGFEQLGVQKIMLEVFSDNISAMKTYLRAGFIVNEKEYGNKLLKMELLKDNSLLYTTGKNI